MEIEGLPKDPEADVPPEQALSVLRNFLATMFPLLVPAARIPSQQTPSHETTNARQDIPR